MDTHPRLVRRNLLPVALVILAVVGAAIGARYVTRARDDRRQALKGAILRLQLKALRLAIVKYEGRHHVYPRALGELVTDGDIHAIPVDPITGSSTSWKTATEERVQVDDFRVGSTAARSGIIDVHSGAPGTDSKGKPWAEY
jgi:general secretion pathway protein G